MTKSKQRFARTSQYGIGGLVGEFTASYASLVRLFGEPNSEGDGHKVSTEWRIKDKETGQLFSLYDWKATSLYGDTCSTVEAFRALPSYAWHIGGTTDPTAFTEWLQGSIAHLHTHDAFVKQFDAPSEPVKPFTLTKVDPAIPAIRAMLAAYKQVHAKSMADLRATEYATDIVSIAGTASRQLAVIQALEGLLLELGEDVGK